MEQTCALNRPAVCLLLVACYVVTPSHETHHSSSTNTAALNNSHVSRRSPLNHGHVVGIDDARTVPHILYSTQAHSLRSDFAHVTKSGLSDVVHGLTVRGHASQHSVTKIMSFGKCDCNRALNQDPVDVMTHALVPTVTRVTTSTLSEHGLTKSPTLTVVEHSLVPVAALSTKASHGQSRSAVTVTRDSVTAALLTEDRGQARNSHVLAAVSERVLLRHAPATHTVVQKVSTLTHDPDPLITHDVSVTHITNGALLTQKLLDTPEHQNVFRTHYGGFGVGIDVGGHGSGHGFYV